MVSSQFKVIQYVHNMKYKNHSKEKGFTLIELMVSISIFTMIAIVALGAMITIIDANRKARSLSTIMNNLNFSVESMTRSVKTGDKLEGISNDKFKVFAIDFDAEDVSGDGTFPRVWIIYKLEDEAIQKCVGNKDTWSESNCYPITSEQIIIQRADFRVYGAPSSSDGVQPRLSISLSGKTGDEVRGTDSSFNIQTTVSQRKLDRE